MASWPTAVETTLTASSSLSSWTPMFASSPTGRWYLPYCERHVTGTFCWEQDLSFSSYAPAEGGLIDCCFTAMNLVSGRKLFSCDFVLIVLLPRSEYLDLMLGTHIVIIQLHYCYVVCVFCMGHWWRTDKVCIGPFWMLIGGFVESLLTDLSFVC